MNGDQDQLSFASADGVHRCHVQEWLPDGPPRGVVQIVHGMADHIGRYREFARFLTAAGYAVLGEDHLGHGLTAGPGEWGYFAEHDGWNTVVRDVRTARSLAMQRHPDVPHFLLGHSLGSLLTRQYLIDYPGTVAGALLSGTGHVPTLAAGAGAAALSGLARVRGANVVSALLQKPFGSYNRRFAPTRTEADWFSRDPAMVDANLADPLCGFPATIGLSRDLLVGARGIGNRKNLRRMDPSTPVLLFSGGEDPVGGRGTGVRRVAAGFLRAGSGDVTVRIYPGGRHEMLAEVNREQVYADILRWLERLHSASRVRISE
ncbi:alpha/beta fold hydrolase [Tomitella biformata]|uniref:alpha/beta fold hydrolase n=1 Tax=Tomitella biformata TaxID=630403 RepID=UPI0004637CD4|nr:alpha/beta hydrolase [Tomitella biformata]